MKQIAVALVFLLMCSSALIAIEEKNHVQDNGGGTVSGGSYDNLASIGQAVICMSSGGSYQNCAGFIGSLMGSSMAIEEQPPDKNPDKPKAFEISQAYPNPFNSVTRFNIEIPESGLLFARFYDMNGRMVYGENKEVDAGFFILDFDAGNLPSGTYLYQISMGNNKVSGKVLLMK